MDFFFSWRKLHSSLILNFNILSDVLLYTVPLGFFIFFGGGRESSVLFWEIRISVNCISCVHMLLSNSHVFILKDSYSVFEHLPSICSVKNSCLNEPVRKCLRVVHTCCCMYLTYLRALEIGPSDGQISETSGSIWSNEEKLEQ